MDTKKILRILRKKGVAFEVSFPVRGGSSSFLAHRAKKAKGSEKITFSTPEGRKKRSLRDIVAVRSMSIKDLIEETYRLKKESNAFKKRVQSLC